MTPPPPFQRLLPDIVPDARLRDAARRRVLAKIRPEGLMALVQSVEPASSFHLRLRQRVMRAIHSRAAQALQWAAAPVSLDASAFVRLRSAILTRLTPVHRPLLSSGLKWSAAFAAFVLLIRSTPFLLLSPVTAEAGVQLLPTGVVMMMVGGVTQEIDAPLALRSSALLRTTDTEATLVFGDRGVLRLAPHSALRLHDDGAASEHSLTATFIEGRLWALGLTAPFAHGLNIEAGDGVIAVNAGSVSIERSDTHVVVTTYDRGASVLRGQHTQLLVTGEQASYRADAAALGRRTVPTSAFAQPWVASNLERDAVHRADIARLQAARSEHILPTSLLYPAKRFAEEVDVLFSLSRDERAQKRLQQAGTRLREGVALLGQGQGEEASGPLQEYATTLVALAGDQHDNLVKDIIRTQIAEATAAIGDDGAKTAASLELLSQAVASVGAAVPLGDVSSKDVEGYVLVDSLARIQHQLRSAAGEPEKIAALYADLRPYLADLLRDEAGVHPLLRREAESLLAGIAALATSVPPQSAASQESAVLLALARDAQQYIPSEPQSLLITEEELLARVQAIYDRIFLFSHPQSRLNQLMEELRQMEGDPNQSRLLRRLKAALPQDGLARFVKVLREDQES